MQVRPFLWLFSRGIDELDVSENNTQLPIYRIHTGSVGKEQGGHNMETAIAGQSEEKVMSTRNGLSKWPNTNNYAYNSLTNRNVAAVDRENEGMRSGKSMAKQRKSSVSAIVKW
ncbi:hypothetical protein Ancab_008392 [Ancistrocladus abbreviatus]